MTFTENILAEFEEKFQYQGDGKYYYGNESSKWFAVPRDFKSFLTSALERQREAIVPSEEELYNLMCQYFHNDDEEDMRDCGLSIIKLLEERRYK